MFYKIYEKIKQFIKENYLFLLFYLVLVAVLTYPLPYYIYTGGGLINVSDKIEFIGKTESSGSYNMCYVSEVKATLPSYLLSYIIPNWERVSKDEVALNSKETAKDISTRDKIYLTSSNQGALLTAFKYANMDYEILDSNPIVVYVMEEAKNDFKIGDEIISINNIEINSREDISDFLSNTNVGDTVSIKVRNNNKEYIRSATIIEEDNRKLLGISIEDKIEIKTDPIINFTFSNNESGPSGGLILSLALYDYLIDEDITKGLKISGTGTIDTYGNVGSIGGVKYKLKGAVKKKSDIFFVPNGENYEEAIKLKNENDYDIDIVGVSNFQEALNYLKNVK